jgi:hypothetical protein
VQVKIIPTRNIDWPKIYIKGLIIWTLLSRRLVVATTTKPNLGHLKAFSNEINPNPIIFLNRPLTFYCYIKGAITVPTEDFKYYHATSWTPSSALPELASCVTKGKKWSKWSKVANANRLAWAKGLFK